MKAPCLAAGLSRGADRWMESGGDRHHQPFLLSAPWGPPSHIIGLTPTPVLIALSES